MSVIVPALGAVALVVRLVPLMVTPWPFRGQKPALKVPVALARIAVVVKAKLLTVGFDELVIVRLPHPAPEQPLGRELTVPMTLPWVALVVSAKVFEFAKSPIVIEVLEEGALAKVPVAVSDVALVFSVVTFAPLVIVTVLAADVGEAEKVPV